MKKEDKNEIKKMVIILIYLFIICICLTWGGFHVYHIGLINEAQLGYLGAIIGGGMTLLGVIFTINHTNAIREIDRKERDLERKEELSIQYKPVIDIVSVNQEDNIPKDRSTFKNQEIRNKLKSTITFGIIELESTFSNNKNIFLSIITLKNFGRGEGTIEFNENAFLDNTDDFQIIYKEDTYTNYKIKKGYKIEIPRNYKMSVLLCLFCDSSIEEKKTFKLNIPVTVHDQFKYKKYSYLMELSYSINKNENCLTNIFFDFKAIK